jgi:hypothetical protein
MMRRQSAGGATGSASVVQIQNRYSNHGFASAPLFPKFAKAGRCEKMRTSETERQDLSTLMMTG